MQSHLMKIYLNGIVYYVLIVVIFHLTMYFDQDYPALPPKMKLCTTIPHPKHMAKMGIQMIKNIKDGQQCIV